MKTIDKRDNLGIENTEELRVLLSEKDEKISQLEKQVSELEWYKEQVLALTKARMGKSSEKITDGQLNLFNEIEEFVDVSVQEPEIARKKNKTKKVKEADFSKLPSTTIHHELKDKSCGSCDESMKELQPTVSHILKYKPAVYSIETHVTHNYVCKPCTDTSDLMSYVSAEGAPKRLIEGSVASSSVIAGLVNDKYVKAIPLYRNEQELQRRGVPLSRATMSNWLTKVSNDYLGDLYNHMLEDLRKQHVIHMDETTLSVLEDKKDGLRSKSYEWIMVSGKYESNQIALYHYNASREHKFANHLLGDFKGYVHSDGYEAYQGIKNVINVGCMAHARRKFVEAMETNALHKKYKKLAVLEKQTFLEENPSYYHTIYILNQISQLFDQEKNFADLSSTERYDARIEISKPIVEILFTYIHDLKDAYPKKSKMGGAITYALNNERYLRAFLLDGDLELSNNRGERVIKPFVIGRKNWLFSNTKNGAQVSSIYYSIVETAKLNNLDIQGYLEYVLDELVDIPKNQRNQELSRLMPYSNNLPDHLYSKSK